MYDQEGILYAELDLAEVAQGKYDLDVVGHYNRPDVFQLVINEGPPSRKLRPHSGQE